MLGKESCVAWHVSTTTSGQSGGSGSRFCQETLPPTLKYSIAPHPKLHCAHGWPVMIPSILPRAPPQEQHRNPAEHPKATIVKS